MTVRSLAPSDYETVTAVVDDFDLIDTGTYREGVPISLDYAGAGEHRVLFRKTLAAGAG